MYHYCFLLQKGGMLKLYPGGSEEAVKILPKLDRLLLFWSDRRNPHEVEPSHDIRLVGIHVDYTQLKSDLKLACQSSCFVPGAFLQCDYM